VEKGQGQDEAEKPKLLCRTKCLPPFHDTLTRHSLAAIGTSDCSRCQLDADGLRDGCPEVESCSMPVRDAMGDRQNTLAPRPRCSRLARRQGCTLEGDRPRSRRHRCRFLPRRCACSPVSLQAAARLLRHWASLPPTKRWGKASGAPSAPCRGNR
jgi:hypothetical protein